MELLGIIEDLEDAKKKKPLSKKAQAKAAEEAKQQLIKQKQEYLKQLKIRVHMEWEINQSKIETYDTEFEERKNIMLKSYKKLKDIQQSWKEYSEQQRHLKQWAQYMKCDRLPNCSSVAELNAYIFAWTELDTSCLMDDCIRKTNTVMQLLNDIEGVFKDPGPDCPSRVLDDLKQLQNQLRSLLREDIDRATFYLFSRIESDMVSINVTTSKYYVKCTHFLMNLWAELMTPTPSSKGKEVRRSRKIVFEEAEVTIVIPPSLNDIFMVVRVMWLNYDHLSDTCRSYSDPPIPDFYSLNMFDLFISHHKLKKELIKLREEQEVQMKAKIEAIPAEPTLSQELLVWESEPQRSLSEEVIFKECEEEDNLLKQTVETLNEFEVNLRKRTFLKKIFLLDILHQPPQAKSFRFKHSVTLRQEAPNLKPVDFYIKYPPPEEKQEETAEQEERHETKQPHFNPLVEELKKLLQIQIKIPDSMILFELPELASWDPINNYWSTEDIHDVIYNEEEGTIDFKTGRLGLVGLHVNRYCHFPFQDWIFEPSEEHGIDFYLKTPKMELHFNIREGKVCLEFMKNVPSRVMNWILGKYYKPAELMEHMKNGGLDIFPAHDASNFLENIQSKHLVIERNIYEVWALFSKTFRFKRSKFNQEAGRKNVVFQAQEIYKNHQVDFCLIQTTMCLSYVLDINEDSSIYLSHKAPSMKSYLDLYSLLESNSTGQAKRQIDSTCYLLVQTVKDFLECIRPLSFS